LLLCQSPPNRPTEAILRADPGCITSLAGRHFGPMGQLVVGQKALLIVGGPEAARARGVPRAFQACVLPLLDEPKSLSSSTAIS
jgi:hypothetical protein